jgi:hypothetical protein
MPARKVSITAKKYFSWNQAYVPIVKHTIISNKAVIRMIGMRSPNIRSIIESILAIR